MNFQTMSFESWLNKYNISKSKLKKKIERGSLVLERVDNQKDIIKITSINLEDNVVYIKIIESDFNTNIGFSTSYNISGFSWIKYKPKNISNNIRKVQ